MGKMMCVHFAPFSSVTLTVILLLSIHVSEVQLGPVQEVIENIRE